ncbi:MAG: IS66 family insertion sequence element accessory protein TnpB [Clostridia bacterium]|nr:IS66 family insertion sequence element accessory protein TnpB [Clostridia bacterium]
MKTLVWDGDGFLLMYKRLDSGRYTTLPAPLPGGGYFPNKSKREVM